MCPLQVTILHVPSARRVEHARDGSDLALAMLWGAIVRSARILVVVGALALMLVPTTPVAAVSFGCDALNNPDFDGEHGYSAPPFPGVDASFENGETISIVGSAAWTGPATTPPFQGPGYWTNADPSEPLEYNIPTDGAYWFSWHGGTQDWIVGCDTTDFANNIHVSITSDWVEGFSFDPAGGDVDISVAGFGSIGVAPIDGSGYFFVQSDGLGGHDFLPGQTVVASQGSNVSLLHVVDLAMTLDGTYASGSGPFGSDLSVEAVGSGCFGHDMKPVVVDPDNGFWEVNFEDVCSEGLGEDPSGSVFHGDDTGGDATVAEAFIVTPSAYFVVNPLHGWIEGSWFAPNSPVDVLLDGVSVVTEPLETEDEGNFFFEPGELQELLQPNVVVTVDDGDTVKSLTLVELTHDGLDFVAESAFGTTTALPGSNIVAYVFDRHDEEPATAILTGTTWTADFSTLNPPWNDVVPGMGSRVQYFDSDGDSIFIFGPELAQITVNPDADLVSGQGFAPETYVTVRIDQGSGWSSPFQIHTYDQGSFDANSAQFGYIDIKPGNMVQVTDEIITKTVEVADLTFDELNIFNGSTSGTANADLVEVEIIDDVFGEGAGENVEVDAGGDWEFDAGQFVNLSEHSEGRVTYRDDDGDGTEVIRYAAAALLVNGKTVLSADHVGPAIVASSGATLDCKGHSINAEALYGSTIRVAQPGFTVKNCTILGFLEIGIEAHNAFGLQILKNTVQGPENQEGIWAAIGVFGGSDVSIDSNRIADVTEGIHVEQVSGVVILNNRVDRAQYVEDEEEFGVGILVYESTDAHILDNTVSEAVFGISLDRSRDSEVARNMVKNSLRSGYLMLEGNDNLFTRNTSLDNGWAGIVLIAETGSAIERNTSNGNQGSGIIVFDSEAILVKDNDTARNAQGGGFSAGIFFVNSLDIVAERNDSCHNGLFDAVELESEVAWTRNSFCEPVAVNPDDPTE